MPTFSVVIPCHDAAATIGAAIASLAAQTRADWEAVCVDDGSTDATPARLEALAARDPRIRVIRQENAGPSAARNRGAAAASGGILAFLDADDLWLPGKLDSVARTFEAHPDADAVFGRIAFFREAGGADATTSTVRPGPQTMADVLGENPACTVSNLSVRREAFLATGGFDGAMRHAEDLEWMIRAVAGGLRVVATPDLHVRYRASDDGLSADLFAMHAGWRRATLAAAPRPREFGRAEARHLRYLARRALRTGQPPRTALALALRGLRAAPLAFLGGRHRGPATLIGCLAAPLLPATLRRRAFA